MTSSEKLMEFVFRLRQAGITDTHVMRAMEAIPRDLFVEDNFATRALADTALPIACAQTISAPSVVAQMTQALEVGPRAKVLEIGTGSGYQAAILSCLARRVFTVERHKPLVKRAKERLATLELHNVIVQHHDGTAGLAVQAPFDRIIVTAAGEDVPPPLLDQLATDGILVMPVGSSETTQTLIKVIKTPSGLEYKDICDLRFVPLIEGLA